MSRIYGWELMCLNIISLLKFTWNSLLTPRKKYKPTHLLCSQSACLTFYGFVKNNLGKINTRKCVITRRFWTVITTVIHNITSLGIQYLSDIMEEISFTLESVPIHVHAIEIQSPCSVKQQIESEVSLRSLSNIIKATGKFGDYTVAKVTDRLS
jgi:hypothetical protein